MLVACSILATEPTVLVLAELAGHVIASFVLLGRSVTFGALRDLKACRSVFLFDLAALEASGLNAKELLWTMVGLSAFEAHLGSTFRAPDGAGLEVRSPNEAATARFDAPSNEGVALQDSLVNQFDHFAILLKQIFDPIYRELVSTRSLRTD